MKTDWENLCEGFAECLKFRPDAAVPDVAADLDPHATDEAGGCVAASASTSRQRLTMSSPQGLDYWREPAAVKPAVIANRMASSTEMSRGEMRSRGR